MGPMLRTFARKTTGVVIVMTGVGFTCVVAGGAPRAQSGSSVAAPTMPVKQQNDLVQKRCVPCHSGARPKGGLLLEQFDAAAPDPAVARMMLIKIERDGAIF